VPIGSLQLALDRTFGFKCFGALYHTLACLLSHLFEHALEKPLVRWKKGISI
jgi:hypothetical protein